MTPTSRPEHAPALAAKPNWQETKKRFVDWWNGKGVIAGSWPGVRRPRPRDPSIPDPGPPSGLTQQWEDIGWRCAHLLHQANTTDYPLETLPVADPWLGPGSLALYLGSKAKPTSDSMWYDPVPLHPENPAPIRLDPANYWWRLQLELIDRLRQTVSGQVLVGTPDLVENWDILASLRDAQELLLDMLEQPGWVKERIAEINAAWFEAYDVLREKIRAQDGESMFGWFRLWAPGRVAKVQCDGCSMFSPEMFREFVVPALAEQCARLDYSMYHLDGTACMDKLDALLEIPSLTAIEWTPEPRVPGGGSPEWYDLYRRILRAGKRVQVLGAAPEEIEPLLDAVGCDGIYFLCFFSEEAEAEKYQRVMERVRS